MLCLTRTACILFILYYIPIVRLREKKINKVKIKYQNTYLFTFTVFNLIYPQFHIII